MRLARPCEAFLSYYGCIFGVVLLKMERNVHRLSTCLADEFKFSSYVSRYIAPFTFPLITRDACREAYHAPHTSVLLCRRGGVRGIVRASLLSRTPQSWITDRFLFMLHLTQKRVRSCQCFCCFFFFFFFKKSLACGVRTKMMVVRAGRYRSINHHHGMTIHIVSQVNIVSVEIS